MSDSSSEEETVVVALPIAANDEEKTKRLWVHNINVARTAEGEYHTRTLFPRLKKDNTRFFRYFRMSYEKFIELCILFNRKLKKLTLILEEVYLQRSGRR